jgi:hypothetical protein
VSVATTSIDAATVDTKPEWIRRIANPPRIVERPGDRRPRTLTGATVVRAINPAFVFCSPNG